jgi:hypothetical protein
MLGDVLDDQVSLGDLKENFEIVVKLGTSHSSERIVLLKIVEKGNGSRENFCLYYRKPGP